MDARLGWLHAVAHGADTVRAFGRSPRLAVADLRGLLDTVVDRVFADAGYLFAHGEDDRLGYALASVLTGRNSPRRTRSVGWPRVEDAIRGGEPGPVPAWASNTLRTLNSLYVFADRGARWYDPDRGAMGPATPLPHAAAVKECVARVVGISSTGLA